MTCDEFRGALDGREGRGLSLAPDQREHALRCAACAFALRLEEELVAASGWAEAARMSLESKARVLAKAKVGRLFFAQRAAGLLGDSAFSALVTLVVAGALVTVLPGLAGRLVPPGALEAVKPYFEPLAGLAREIVGVFAPLTGQSWGAVLLAIILFMLVFSAVLSAKVLVPRWQT